MINTVNDSIYLAGFFIFCIITASYSQETKQLISSSEADTWVATDAIGRSVVTLSKNAVVHKDRYVGIFYFIWHGAGPVTRTFHSISIDGKFADWKNAGSVYTDDQGDIFHRKHPGWGRIKEYVNNSGRNDIIEARVTGDAHYVSFYVKTARSITARNQLDWMRLCVSVKDENKNFPNWEGYHFLVNRKPLNSTATTLERNKGGWEWEKVSNLKYNIDKNELELRILKEGLGITGNSFSIDFEWADNAPLDGNAMLINNFFVRRKSFVASFQG